ncbi:hypothetical protein ACT4S5_08010 [Kocuria oceani]|uniref:hypothetical protein n=1 Tax=Kocuria oceani TaxID=988827 RepID=UPI0040350969
MTPRVPVGALRRRLRHLVRWAWLQQLARGWAQAWRTGPSPLRCALRSCLATEPVTGDAPVVVSLTSYGERIRTVHWVIEAIGAGSVRPQRLILWLADAQVVADPPEPLAGLVGRGLEIRHSQDWGPHKKYYPYVCSQEHHVLPLVIADDDVLYGKNWLAELLATHETHPGEVVTHRAHRMALADGKILPYARWTPGAPPQASFATFPTGVSGVLYPPALLEALRKAGGGFTQCAPMADDVWLHMMSVRHGVRIRPVRDGCTTYRPLPGARLRGLKFRNVLGGGNDTQIAATYTGEDITRIRKDRPGS